MTSTHQIDQDLPPSGDGCVECLDGVSLGWWLHLRRCAACGHVGCCDSSPSQHARRHWQDTGHRYIQSFEPGEDWFWDFDTDRYADGRPLRPPHHHPPRTAGARTCRSGAARLGTATAHLTGEELFAYCR